MNDDMEDIMSFSGEMIKMLPIGNFNCLTVEPIPTPVEYTGSMKDRDWYIAVGKVINYHENRLRGEGNV